LNRVTSEKGLFEWNDEIGLEFWRVHVSLINFWDGYQEFKSPPSGCAMSIQKTIQLRPITKQNERIALENIYYDLDKYNLRTEGMRELDKVVGYMQSHPAVRIELSSHTDCRNSSGYNETLSQNRAQSCVDYIVSKGILAERIVAMGYGERVLVNHCSDDYSCECNEDQSGCQICDEKFHQANRRTELKLLGDQ
jgi:outer membrane protein OmpA-like peptidoglycan-associated protein